MTPRAKFIAEANVKKIAARAWDASMQASTHDPDIMKELKLINLRIVDCMSRISVLERQMERIGAPQYRKVH